MAKQKGNNAAPAQKPQGKKSGDHAWDKPQEVTTDEEPLYVTKTVWDFDLFYKFLTMIQMKVNQMIPKMVILCLGLFWISYLAMQRGHLFLMGGLLFIAIAYPVGFFRVLKRNAVAGYDANPQMQNAEITYEFYRDRAIARAVTGITELYYEEIYKSVETNDAFYFMVTPTSGFAILRENVDDKMWNFLRKIKDQFPGTHVPFHKQPWK